MNKYLLNFYSILNVGQKSLNESKKRGAKTPVNAGQGAEGAYFIYIKK